jgi:hypothetical protein
MGIYEIFFSGKTYSMAKKQWKPAEFIYEFTDENLTAGAGLGPLIDLFVASRQYEKLRACLPERKSNASYPTEQFALSPLSGFWYGHDSLDDLEEFDQDPGVEDKLGGLPSLPVQWAIGYGTSRPLA